MTSHPTHGPVFPVLLRPQLQLWLDPEDPPGRQIARRQTHQCEKRRGPGEGGRVRGPNLGEEDRFVAMHNSEFLDSAGRNLAGLYIIGCGDKHFGISCRYPEAN